MTHPTEHNLKLMLAKKLPEKIEIVWHELGPNNDGYCTIHWLDKGRVILDTEWDYIVRLVEEQMLKNISIHMAYAAELGARVGKLAAISASWPQRTQAMYDIGFLKGE